MCWHKTFQSQACNAPYTTMLQNLYNQIITWAFDQPESSMNLVLKLKGGLAFPGPTWCCQALRLASCPTASALLHNPCGSQRPQCWA